MSYREHVKVGLGGIFMVLLGGAFFAFEIIHEAEILAELSSAFSNFGCGHTDQGVRCGFVRAISLAISLIMINLVMLFILFVGLFMINDSINSSAN